MKSVSIRVESVNNKVEPVIIRVESGIYSYGGISLLRVESVNNRVKSFIIRVESVIVG